MPKIDYNKETKTLTIKISGKKSVDSDVQGNIVVDYDKGGNISKIEIMSVSINEFEKGKSRIENFLVSSKKFQVMRRR